ncbi:hypothetical protein BCR42DRAFT_495436 [Absidia repens]|uniref:Zn(2)-C6 fungal-type domain-containing protein n=1 Tax=Absidia repens TaxID=90262 RepID=A0A1X2I340_9FUNG|nr:hypothetical protein BCR42DRAFT_495436 [Absidia repens]
MLQRKKKPVQYFFVDINDPDYYKRIKVARACIDCRKRKSKCDIGVPGSGPCSGCRKHNRVCEFTASTVVSSTPSPTVSSSWQRVQVAQTGFKKRKSRLFQQRRSQTTNPPPQIDLNFNQSQHHSTLSLTVVPENYYNKTTLYSRSENDSVGIELQSFSSDAPHLHVDLPVLCLQKEECPSLPITPPLSLSSPSMLSSTETTPSPPVNMDYAYGTTFPWESSASSCPNMEISMHSVNGVDPVKNDSKLSLSPNMLEHDLFKIYLQHIHPLYPVFPASALNQPHTLPLCLQYAIMALSLLYCQLHAPPSVHMAHDYYNKSSEALQLHLSSDIVTVQTLLILYKYHETTGTAVTHEYFLNSAQTILEQLATPSFMNHHDNEKKEWICRLQWIVFIHQFGKPSTLDGSWRDPPIIRMPCLLPSEQHDTIQIIAISKLLDAIHITNAYSSAIQSLCISVEDPWAQRNPSL